MMTDEEGSRIGGGSLDETPDLPIVEPGDQEKPWHVLGNKPQFSNLPYLPRNVLVNIIFASLGSNHG